MTVQDVWYARSLGCLFLRKVAGDCDCTALQQADASSLTYRTLAPNAAGPFWTVVVAGTEERDLGQFPPDVEVLVTPEGPATGFYGRVNQALADSQGQWIHILPSPDRVPEGFYRHMQEALSGVPEQVGVALCRYTNVEDDGRTFTPFFDALHRGPLSEEWAEELCYGNPLNIPAVVYRRSVFETVGLFSEDLPYCADWELYLRAALGVQWWFVPGMTVTHRPLPPDADVEAQAESNGRRTMERTTILWVRHNRPLPGILAGSYNFM